MSSRVAVLMGSDSDWAVMQDCVAQLRTFGEEPMVCVASAHRTPDDVRDFIAKSEQSGIRVFIAAAGMSAALAGMVAAHTICPVIGVPLEAGPLRGIDSLLSTVQMPSGVPVAGMATGAAGAKNAAILAVQILAISDEALAKKLHTFKADQARRVRQKNSDIQKKLT